ncbi:Erythromycin esterase [compost metagenome]
MDARSIGKAQLAELAHWTQRRLTPLRGTPRDFDDLMDLVGDARIVMLGEASHGTHEFYAQRARMTQRLIEEKGFNIVAIEGDWPDAYRVNQYVRGGPGTPGSALDGFRRFPTWMWRNTVVLDFVAWLRDHNDQLEDAAAKVGFYGLDVYSLHASMEEVVGYLRQVDPRAAEEAARRYACFEPFAEDTQQYAISAHYMSQSCEDEVVSTLQDLRRKRFDYESVSDADAFFQAELNALAAVNAERYYRLMVHGGATTWNLRDRHMVDVLNRLLHHLGPDSKAILWEHNTHIGDFRATYEGRTGHVNVGQLVREQYGADCLAVGFGTHAGSVTAASAWDMPPEFKRVPPARPGSYEAIFHQTGVPHFYLPLKRLQPQDMPGAWLYRTRDERAIGVVYEPDRERYGNYVPSRLADRYDAYFFHDETFAVEPIDAGPVPPGLESYPSGL